MRKKKAAKKKVVVVVVSCTKCSFFFFRQKDVLPDLLKLLDGTEVSSLSQLCAGKYLFQGPYFSTYLIQACIAV